MKLDRYCPGCGGGEGNQSCKIAKCSIWHGKIEYCNQCQEFPCDKYGRADEYDIFITHRNWKQDFEKMKEMGVEAYNSEQRQKQEILELLLEGYKMCIRDSKLTVLIKRFEASRDFLKGKIKDNLFENYSEWFNPLLNERCV